MLHVVVQHDTRPKPAHGVVAIGAYNWPVARSRAVPTRSRWWHRGTPGAPPLPIPRLRSGDAVSLSGGSSPEVTPQTGCFNAVHVGVSGRCCGRSESGQQRHRCDEYDPLGKLHGSAPFRGAQPTKWHRLLDRSLYFRPSCLVHRHTLAPHGAMSLAARSQSRHGVRGRPIPGARPCGSPALKVN